jgi:hypothetical protein
LPALPARASVVIDFDSLEVNNSLLNAISGFPATYTEDGFTIFASNLYYAGQANSSYAGSAGLHVRLSAGTITTVESLGGLFDATSIDLSFLEPTGTSPPVTFTGTYSGGGTTNQTLTINSFGFSPFAFDSSFKNLVSLSWTQGTSPSNGHQFDNLVLQQHGQVPEPASMAVWGCLLGLTVFGGWRRRRALACRKLGSGLDI